jgi:PhzF family phenazine biosynthesis protein
MKKLIVYQIDAFTKEKFKGNPAGVVINADGLNTNQMQQIARELNNSETAFLFKPENNDYDGEIRYFTPEIEVPICGHATIAAMYAKALEDNLKSCILKIKTKIGILPFEIIKVNKDYQVVMTQGEFELSSTLGAEDIKELTNALGISDIELDEKCPIQIASTGHSKVIIGIKSKKKLDSILPDYNKLADLSKKIECNGYFVFTFDSNDSDILTFGRMFAPAIGINEDPVTGNANGPLGGYLVKNKIAKYHGDSFEFSGRQGEKMGRSGTIEVKVKVENHFPVLIQIKGEASVVFKTTIMI